MENGQSQLLPFEGNCYYAGKLLTSMDFETEQDYMINQCRFANSLMLGQGILCGLSMFSLDDFSIMIESGAVADGRDREVVIEKPLVKKLLAIDGFEGLTGSRALLCLAYSGEGVHPAYAVNRQERNQEYECNHISEGYWLFLVDAPAAVTDCRMEMGFYPTALSYGDEDYTVVLTVPSIINSGREVKFSLRTRKLRESSADIQVDTVLAASVLTVVDGGYELKIQTGNVHLDVGESWTFEYWLTAENREYESISVIAGEQDTRVSGGGWLMVRGNAVNLRVSIQNITPGNLVTREIGKLNPEMRLLGQKADSVSPAEFSLMGADSAHITDGVQENGVKRCIPMPARENLRTEFQPCFNEVQEEKGQEEQKPEQEEMQPAPRGRESVWVSGTCGIPLGIRAKKGSTKYSGEIVHGLGKGRVLMQFGVYYLEGDAAPGKEDGRTVFGVSGLFTGYDKAGVPRMETVMKVTNGKRSFTVAVRPMEGSQATVLRLEWMAMYCSPEEETAGGASGGGTVAETPTVIMEPESSHYFGARFQDMESYSLAYELTEEDSGEALRDSIYTAPVREGIYEAYTRCERYPAIGAYAYVAVRKPDGIERGRPWIGIIGSGKARDRDGRVISKQ